MLMPVINYAKHILYYSFMLTVMRTLQYCSVLWLHILRTESIIAQFEFKIINV